MERESEFERRRGAQAPAEGGCDRCRAGPQPRAATASHSDLTRRECLTKKKLEEAGGGEAEGFELAEAELVEPAEQLRGPSPYLGGGGGIWSIGAGGVRRE